MARIRWEPTARREGVAVPSRPLALPRVRNRGERTVVRGVTVFSWNPRRPLVPGRRGSRLVTPRRIDNFGDLLGPVIVAGLLDSIPVPAVQPAADAPRVLTVGSVLQFARDGDVVWGSGVNGKSLAAMPREPRLDVRAVRGPLTRRALLERGVPVPEVYGDPALLAPLLFPGLRRLADRKVRGTLIAPNLNDAAGLRHRPDVLDPQRPLADCLREIAQSERVVGSSLHAVIVAEALGIPAVAVASAAEHPFKYDDYYGGTGRAGARLAADLDDAVRPAAAVPAPQWSPEPLRAAFPSDVWGSVAPEPRGTALPTTAG